MKNNLFTVENYMCKTPVTIPVSANVRDAVSVMLKEKTNGLIVVNKEGRVEGLLGIRDLVSYIVPDYLETENTLAAFESEAVFEDRVKELSEKPIENFIIKKPRTIKKNHTLIEAAVLLSDPNLRQLPVCEEDGSLIGHINRSDIKKALFNALSE